MFDKLDAYDILANLVPGAALVYALHSSGFPTPLPSEIGAFLLVSFVAGVTTNRIGSLALDPFLRAVKFLGKKDYQRFVLSERRDKKLETLVANHGLYRTFAMAGILYLLAIVMLPLVSRLQLTREFLLVELVVVAIGVFLLSLRKEDGYIATRIQAAHP